MRLTSPIQIETVLRIISNSLLTQLKARSSLLIDLLLSQVLKGRLLLLTEGAIFVREILALVDAANFNRLVEPARAFHLIVLVSWQGGGSKQSH